MYHRVTLTIQVFSLYRFLLIKSSSGLTKDWLIDPTNTQVSGFAKPIGKQLVVIVFFS